MRPGAGEGGEVGDAERVREVGDRRGYLLMCSGNATFVATASPLLPSLPPSFCLSFAHCLLSSDTDMEPKVFWQSSALYRGQESTKGQSRAVCVCVCVSVLLSL